MLRADGKGGIVERLVECTQFVELREFFVGEQIYLIKDKERAHAIGLAGREEAVDEGSGSDGVVDGDDKRYLVDVSGEDMTLFAQVRGTTDDVVPPLFDLLDPVGAIGERLYFHEVPDGYRIGTTDASDAEIALDMTLRIRTIVQPNDVTAARRFNDESPHQLAMTAILS